MLEVFCNKCRPTLEVTSISDNKSELLNKIVLSSVLSNFSKKDNVRGMKDLILYKYENPFRVTLVLQNMVKYNVNNNDLKLKRLARSPS